jgi:hypothetical protein
VNAATSSRAAAAAHGSDVADVWMLDDDGGDAVHSDSAADDAIATQLGRHLTNTASAFPENYYEPVIFSQAPSKIQEQSPRLQLPLPEDFAVAASALPPQPSATAPAAHLKNTQRAFILPTLPPVMEEEGLRISLPEPAQAEPSGDEFMVGLKPFSVFFYFWSPSAEFRIRCS